jgi:MoxR-like ATPase
MHYASPLAPAIDPFYIFDPVNLPAMLGALACTPAERVWCYGPRASGKSVGAQQIAARLGRPFFRVSFNRATEASDIIGDIGLVNGATQWVDGPVTQALRTPGALCLLDEITYCPTAHLAALNPLLERGALSLRLPKTGETLTSAPDVCFVVCDNTNGHGATNEYVGRVQISADLLDRFGLFLEFDYLPADTERRVLRAMVHSYCGVKPTSKMARSVCKLMGVARSKADAGELEGAPSLRRAAAFCTALVQGMEPSRAYVLTVVNPAPLDSAEALRQIFAAIWDHGVSPPIDPNANPFAATPAEGQG